MAASLDQDERMACLDAALKDCIQQISSLQEERDVEVKEANNRLVRSLLRNQELVEQLQRDKLHLEAQLDALIDRVDSVEKENAFLKCECCALERELLLHPESADKVTRLEDECQQLRLLVNDRDDTNTSRKINILVDRLCDVEEENTALREIIAARESELCSTNHSVEDYEKQIVPVVEAKAEEISILEHGHWPWNVLDMILDEHQASKRSISELLDEIKGSLAPQKKQSELNLNESVCRMIELIEEISPASLVSTGCSDADLDYSVHVLHWRNCELVPILQRFVLSCSLVLSGSYGLEDFAMQLTALMEWAIGSCITLDDASRVRGKVKKHFSVDRPKSESELDITFVDSQNVMTKMIRTQCDLQEENKWLNHNIRSLKAANEEFETRLRSVVEDNDCLRTRLEESKGTIGRLQEELEDLKESVGIFEEQFENQKLINEDLDTQITVTKAKQNEMARKLSRLEVELEDKKQSYEELETTCLELQLQLEIVSRKGTPDLAEERFGKDKQNVSETTTECTKPAEFKEHKEKSNQHHSLLDILTLTNDDDTKTEARVITALSSQTSRGGLGFVKKLFVSRRKYSPQINTRTLKRPKRSDSISCAYYE